MPDEFSTADVERIARLARLELTADDKALFARQLGAILEYAQQIQSIDTADVAATAHASALEAPTRSDETQPSLERDDTLAAAPATDEGRLLFKVPRVLG